MVVAAAFVTEAISNKVVSLNSSLGNSLEYYFSNNTFAPRPTLTARFFSPVNSTAFKISVSVFLYIQHLAIMPFIFILARKL